jgi:hypothetical protein
LLTGLLAACGESPVLKVHGFTGCGKTHRKRRENSFLDGTKRQGTTSVVPEVGIEKSGGL